VEKDYLGGFSKTTAQEEEMNAWTGDSSRPLGIKVGSFMSSLPPIDDSSYAPLEYATPAPPPRPGLMTAVGIISILLGSVSVLYSLGGVGSGILYLTMPKMTFQAPMLRPAGAVPGQAKLTFAAPSTQATVQSRTVVTPFAFSIDPRASELTIIVAVLGLGLAILLIVAGSLLLRNSPTTFRLHRTYVILKIPLVVVAAYATWWTVSGMMNNMNAYAGGAGAMSMPAFGNAMAIVQAVISAALSLVYPVALLIVLSTDTAKAYCQMISGRAMR
jgi:hypothetical protein